NAPRRSVVTSYSFVRATVSWVGVGGCNGIEVSGLYPSAEPDANSRHILVPVPTGAELLGLQDRRAQDELRLPAGVGAEDGRQAVGPEHVPVAVAQFLEAIRVEQQQVAR